MFSLLRTLDPTIYTHRSYVLSSGDDFSARRAKDFEDALALNSTSSPPSPSSLPSTYDITTIPRARRVHQSVLTTPLSAMRCILGCFSVLRAPTTVEFASQGKRERPSYGYPDLILTNGPGTAVCVVLASVMVRFFSPVLPRRWSAKKGKMRTIYVESWARVRRLSLSGKILVWVVDRFLVQWDALKGAGGGKAEYIGVLV